MMGMPEVKNWVLCLANGSEIVVEDDIERIMSEKWYSLNRSINRDGFSFSQASYIQVCQICEISEMKEWEWEKWE